MLTAEQYSSTWEVDRAGASAWLGANLQLQARRTLDSLDELETPLVREIVRRADNPFWRSLSHLVNLLGNGWLYPLLLIVTLAELGKKALRPDLTALSAVTIAFAVYFPSKRALARVRPCHRDPRLDRSVRVLDLYSCPSGHCMALAAVGCVLAWHYPRTLPLLAAGLAAVGWSRIALAHHYLSDLLLGVALGVIIALTLCAAFH